MGIIRSDENNFDNNDPGNNPKFIFLQFLQLLSSNLHPLIQDDCTSGELGLFQASNKNNETLLNPENPNQSDAAFSHNQVDRDLVSPDD